MRQHLVWRSAHTLAAVLAFCVAAGAAGAADLAPRSSNFEGVSVAVTPKDVAPGAATWEFSIALNTHSQNLSDDLVKTAVLIDSRGGRHAPTSWEGTPPGGHHRSGILRFKGLGAQADAIELQIRRPNEAAPRSFHWKLK